MGHIHPQAYPANSTNKFGFSESDTSVTVSFYESSDVSSRTSDLIVVVE